MKIFFNFIILCLWGLKRDKVLWSLLAVSLLLLVLVPLFSLFSMRQVQELAVTLSLSATSLFLLVCTVFLGATAIWRDLEKRFAVPVLALPLSRQTFIFGKYFAVGLFLLLSLVILASLSALSVALAAAQYPPERALDWLNFSLAFVMLGLKYLLLLAVTLVLSALSTSFFLPVFGSLGIYFAGSASHQVVEFLVQNPDKFSAPFTQFVQVLSYLLPNFSAFDYHVYAIYGLPLVWWEVGMSFFYGLTYITLILLLAANLFSRREV